MKAPNRPGTGQSWAWPSPPCTRCSSAAGSTGSPASTGSPVSRVGRYEHDHPGDLIHVDVTKFGRIPDGGGHRFVGRHQDLVNRAVTSDREGTRTLNYQPRLGIGYLHTVVDDHSRVAYVEMCEDERADTAIGVLYRAVAWFADRGVSVQRVLWRQRVRVSLLRLARRLRRSGHHAQAHPPLPAADQREDRALPPHSGRGLGLREVLWLRGREACRAAGVDPLLQSSPAPLRHRGCAHQQTQQPPWTSQLGRGTHPVLADAHPSPGPRLRTSSRPCRSHGQVVDDRADDPPIGPSTRTPPMATENRGLTPFPTLTEGSWQTIGYTWVVPRARSPSFLRCQATMLINSPRILALLPVRSTVLTRRVCSPTVAAMSMGSSTCGYSNTPVSFSPESRSRVVR
jgi:hypothetical protein